MKDADKTISRFKAESTERENVCAKAREEVEAKAKAEAQERLKAKERMGAYAAARQEAEEARRISTANELVAFAKSELDDPNDVSYSLALLLAQEAVMTTMSAGEPATPGAEDALRQAIAAAPIQSISFELNFGYHLYYKILIKNGTVLLQFLLKLR